MDLSFQTAVSAHLKVFAVRFHGLKNKKNMMGYKKNLGFHHRINNIFPIVHYHYNLLIIQQI